MELESYKREREKNWGWYYDRIAEIICERFKPKRVLDVGCGDGLLLSFFAKRGVECYGVDISKKFVSLAPENIRRNICLIDVEKEGLPFKDDTFDIVTILEVLEHLHDHSLIISEIYRVLRPNGICLMSSPVDSKIYQAVSKILNLFRKADGIKDYELCEFSPHINVHSKRFWIREFEKVGFELLEDFKRSQKDVILHVINSHAPKDAVARFLVKFGRVGRELRLRLACHLWSTTLIFVKR